MARRRTVPIPGTVTYVNDSGAAGGGIVGQPPWNDASDSSYADLITAAHPDVAISDKAHGFTQATDLGDLPADRTKVSVFGLVRVRALTATGVEAPMRVTLRSSPANVVAQATGTQTPGGGFSWHQIALPITNESNYTAIKQGIANGTLQVDVNMVPIRPASGTWVYPAMRVPEVHLIVETPGGSAPPLRQLGRRDGLGLSPSKSVLDGRSIQGSLRRFGPGTFL